MSLPHHRCLIVQYKLSYIRNHWNVVWNQVCHGNEFFKINPDIKGRGVQFSSVLSSVLLGWILQCDFHLFWNILNFLTYELPHHRCLIVQYTLLYTRNHWNIVRNQVCYGIEFFKINPDIKGAPHFHLLCQICYGVEFFKINCDINAIFIYSDKCVIADKLPYRQSLIVRYKLL